MHVVPRYEACNHRLLHLLLDLLHALREFLPVVHDDVSLGDLGQGLGHLLLLRLALLDLVDTDVADERNAGTHGGSGAGLAVLDSQALLRLDAELLARVQVDGRVRLAGRRVERGSRGVDMLIREEAHEVRLLERSNDPRLCGSRHNAHRVALRLGPLELLRHARALGALLAELLGDAVELHADVFLDFVLLHLEVVLLLQAEEHVAEVVANEVLQEAVGVIAGIDLVLLEHLVGEIGASLEGETLGLAERVIAVEEDVLDLLGCERRSTAARLEAWSTLPMITVFYVKVPRKMCIRGNLYFRICWLYYCL